MVVLAVTWMAKAGRETEVAALFEKLTEQSRKEPGVPCTRCIGTKPILAGFSSTSNIKMMLRLRRTERSAFSATSPKKICQESRNE